MPRKKAKYKKKHLETWKCKTCEFEWCYKTMRCPICESLDTMQII